MTGPRPWHLDAACHGQPPDVMHPNYGSGRTARDQANNTALAICGTCPVLEECLNDAITVELAAGDLGRGGPWGIRGGTTEQARAPILRAARALQTLTDQEEAS